MAFKLPNQTPFRQEVDKPKSSFADNSFFTDSMRQGFGAGEYGTYSSPSFDPQTYASEGLGEGITSAGKAIADAIADRKKMMTTSRDVPSFENKHAIEKVRTLKKGASPDLDSKIQTAKSRGNLKRAARLEGRQERRIERQTEGAKRIEARQAEKTKRASERQKEMTKKSLDTSTDGSNLEMKNDSPNKFLGGITAGIAGAGRSFGNTSGLSQQQMQSAIAPDGKFVGFGNIAEVMRRARSSAKTTQAAQDAQAVQAAQAAGAASGVMGAGATISNGAMDPTNPFEGKTFQITPANMKGNAKPVFSEKTQGMAQAAFGSGLERQLSMPKSGAVTRMTAKQEKAFGPGSEVYEGGNTAIYEGLKAEDNSPAASYENPKTVIDDSHGYVASKAAEAFGQIAEKLIEKKKGDQDENE